MRTEARKGFLFEISVTATNFHRHPSAYGVTATEAKEKKRVWCQGHTAQSDKVLAIQFSISSINDTSVICDLVYNAKIRCRCSLNLICFFNIFQWQR
jgi:hypothetical protein